MNIEEIRLTPEEIKNAKCPIPEIVEPNTISADDWYYHALKWVANTATDKAIKKIVEFVDDYHSIRSNKFAQKYGRAATYNEDGFALPIQVALKKLVEP